MRLRHVAAMLLALTAGWVGTDLLACGDKFLVVSRGTRFERAPSARQHVGILLYANPASAVTKAIASLSVEATLRKAGYRPLLVSSLDEFDKALRSGGWELVVVDSRGCAGRQRPRRGRQRPTRAAGRASSDARGSGGGEAAVHARHQLPDQGPDVRGRDR